MLHIQDMAFAYPGTGEILKKISFDLEEGHCLALLGNNGAGKSTLLKCLNRIHEPKEGVIEVRGQNVHAMKRGDIAKTMAYVAQQSEGTQLTVFDSILLGRKPYIKMNPTDEDIAIAQRAMKRMKLEPFALRYTDELSGGELQKVVLARALAQEPKILLLDEPTSNLDLYNQHEVLRVVSQIAKTDKTAVVVIIHDLNLALRYCDRFLLIQDGMVYQYGDNSVITPEVIRDVYHVEAQIVEIMGRKMVAVE